MMPECDLQSSLRTGQSHQAAAWDLLFQLRLTGTKAALVTFTLSTVTHGRQCPCRAAEFPVRKILWDFFLS